MALTRKWIASPNYSSRGGSGVRLIVLHTAEGATTIESLGNFFANPANDVSSHVGIDDKAGVVGEYVKRGNKAWTAGNANPVAVQAELCGFASWSKDTWKNKHHKMLENTAKWIAEESKHFGIPITKLTASQAQGSGRGVCQHNDLGSWGGGHWDCGGGFPMDYVLDLARGGSKESEVLFVDPPPDWFYGWLDWYVNTDRDPAKRPKGAPEDIPQWAWTAQGIITDKIMVDYGMTKKERDWINWYIDTPRDPDKKPANVPATIPSHWWDDEIFVLNQQAKYGRDI
jgi:N-acetylmuramoyl-L-alanine amidase